MFQCICMAILINVTLRLKRKCIKGVLWLRLQPLDHSEIYCKIINICWTFNFVILWVTQSMNLRSQQNTCSLNSNIAYNLKFMNSSVNEHVQCRHTTKFHAHEIEWFHRILWVNMTYSVSRWTIFIKLLPLKLKFSLFNYTGNMYNLRL